MDSTAGSLPRVPGFDSWFLLPTLIKFVILIGSVSMQRKNYKGKSDLTSLFELNKPDFLAKVVGREVSKSFRWQDKTHLQMFKAYSLCRLIGR